MVKIIQIEVPDWVDVEEIKTLVTDYILKKSKSLTKDEYTKLMNVNLDEIVEYSLEEEIKILSETREKAKERLQW